jgi:hypothetical protein
MHFTLLDTVFGMEPLVFFFVLIFSIDIFLLISYYLTRWILSIEKHLRNQKQQINLLLKIAEKIGVSQEDQSLQEINKKNNED